MMIAFFALLLAPADDIADALARVARVATAMIDGDVCNKDGLHARRRVHGLVSLCPMRRNYESLLDEAAQRGEARAA